MNRRRVRHGVSRNLDDLASREINLSRLACPGSWYNMFCPTLPERPWPFPLPTLPSAVSCSWPPLNISIATLLGLVEE